MQKYDDKQFMIYYNGRDRLFFWKKNLNQDLDSVSFKFRFFLMG